MSYLSYIALPRSGRAHRPITDLADTHGVTPRAVQMYQRFFGLEQVRQHDQPLEKMLGEALDEVLAQLPDAGAVAGHLVYCKTQTHGTLNCDGWLRSLADRHGLTGWEVSSLSMTSCASALVQMHVARLIAPGPGEAPRPLIILTGEKTFHPSVSRLPVGLLAEAPAAALFNAGPGSWTICGTSVRHLARFHENPDAMGADQRRALQEAYLPQLTIFLQDSLHQYSARLSTDMVFLPHNLNLPVTRQLLDHFGWGPRCFYGDLARTGHGFCSDIFLNLEALRVDGRPAPQVLVLAAGTGVTFATCLLDRFPLLPV